MRKTLLVIPLILVLMFPGALAVVADSFFENTPGVTQMTIFEGESIDFTAVAFTIDPPLTGYVQITDYGAYVNTLDEFNVNNGTFGDYYNTFDVDYSTYNYGCGSFLILLQAYDDFGDADSAELNLYVTCNQPPQFNLPASAELEEDSGWTDNVLDLEDYADDDYLEPDELEYSIESQSNTGLVTCSIDYNNNLDCNVVEENGYGTSEVTISVEDHLGAITEDTINIIVVPVNDPVVVSDIPDVEFAEDGSNSEIDLDDYFYDVETPDYLIEWTYSGNDHVHVSIAGNHVVTFTADENWYGEETITFTAEDEGGNTDSDDVLVTVNAVNDPPVLEPIGDLEATEGVPFYFDVNATDVDSDNLFFSDDADFFDIDAATGEIDFTPGNNDAGIYDVRITVSDMQAVDFEDITFTIYNSNQVPGVEITQPANGAHITKDIPTQFIAVGFDPDPYDELEFTWDFGDGTGAEGDNVMKAYNETGNFTVTVTVTDGEDEATDSITVEVFEHTYDVINLASYSDDQFSVEEDTFYRNDPLYISFNVVDLVNNSLIPGNVNEVYIYNNRTGYGDVNLTAYNGEVQGVTIIDGEPEVPDGNYYYYLPNIPLGDEQLGWNIVFVFTFEGEGSGQATLPIEILNNPVELDDIPDVEFDEDEYYTGLDLDDYVYDVETPDNEINWSFITSEYIWIEIDPDTRVVTFTPIYENWYGSVPVFFYANDNDGSEAMDEVQVTVNPVNDAPVVSDIPDIVMDEGTTYEGLDLDDYVYDVDNNNDELQWMYSGNFALEVLINISSHEVTIIAPANWSGEEVVTFTVTDPGNLSDSDNVTITVIGENHPPQIVNYYPVEDELSLWQSEMQLFSIEAIDIDGDDIEYSWYIDDVLVAESTQEVSFQSYDVGTYEVKGVASDGEFEAVHTWTVDVMDVLAFANYTDNTTDFAHLPDPSLVYDALLEKAHGSAFFAGPLNLSQLYSYLPVLIYGVVIDDHIISIDNAMLPEFAGQPAIITLQDVPEDFVIYYSDTYTLDPYEVTNPCPVNRCFNVVYDPATKVLTFDVTHVTTYAVRSPVPVIPEPEKTPRGDIKIMALKPFDYSVHAGDYLDVMVSFYNEGNEDVEDVTITASILSLGLKYKYSSFNLGVDEKDTRVISIYIPSDSKPGEYYLRVSGYGDGDHNAKHVPIYVY